MFRIVVTWYLVLATLAGPAAFCCCTSKGLANPPRPASRTERTEPQSEHRSCCHRQKHKPAPPADTPRVAPDETPGDGPASPCRCKQQAEEPALPAVDQDAGRAVAGSVAFLAGDLPRVATDFVPAAPFTDGSTTLPFLSARDLLRAHHRLRC